MADLTMIGAGLDAVVRDIERLTLQQLASSGRVDQRIQKVHLALRPIMRRCACSNTVCVSISRRTKRA
jgi:hypothetical protein